MRLTLRHDLPIDAILTVAALGLRRCWRSTRLSTRGARCWSGLPLRAGALLDPLLLEYLPLGASALLLEHLPLRSSNSLHALLLLEHLPLRPGALLHTLLLEQLRSGRARCCCAEPGVPAAFAGAADDRRRAAAAALRGLRLRCGLVLVAVLAAAVGLGGS